MAGLLAMEFHSLQKLHLVVSFQLTLQFLMHEVKWMKLNMTRRES